MSDSEEDVVLSEDEEESSEPEIEFGSDSENSDIEDGDEDEEEDEDEDNERQIYGSDKSQMIKECNDVIEVVSIPANERMTRSIASAE